MSPRTIGILKKGQVIKDDRWLNTLIRNYCEQTTKSNAVSVAKAVEIAPTESEYRALLAAKKAPMRPGIDFIPSDAGSTVLFGGFVAGWAGLSSLYAGEDIQERLDRVAYHWARKSRGGVKAHHIIYSIAPSFQQRLLDAGIPLQDILMASSLRAINRFAAWATPGATIGHLTGFHSDRKNGHLHMLVYPYDSRGQRLNLSRLAAVNLKSGTRARVDFQGYLHGAYEDSLRVIEKSLTPAPLFPLGNSAQAGTRTAILSMADIRIVNDKFAAQKTSTEHRLRPQDLMVRHLAESRSAPVVASAINEKQGTERRSFIELEHEFKGDKSASQDFDKQNKADLLAWAERASKAAVLAKKAAEDFGAAFDRYSQSPLAYRMQVLGPSGLDAPVSISNIAKSIRHPLATEVDPTRNFIVMSQATEDVALARERERKGFSAAIKPILESVGKDSDALFGLSNLIAAVHAEGRAVSAAAQGVTPFYLKHEITPEASDVPLREPDGGLARLLAEIRIGADEERNEYRPFEASTDADRAFGPERRSRTRDDEVAVNAPSGAPEHGGSPLYDYTSILPEPDGPDATMVRARTESARLLQAATEGPAMM